MKPDKCALKLCHDDKGNANKAEIQKIKPKRTNALSTATVIATITLLDNLKSNASAVASNKSNLKIAAVNEAVRHLMCSDRINNNNGKATLCIRTQ